MVPRALLRVSRKRTTLHFQTMAGLHLWRPVSDLCLNRTHVLPCHRSHVGRLGEGRLPNCAELN